MQKSRRMLIFAGWIIVVSFVALSVATYAWMSIATSYRVSDLELSVITENAMEIAPDVDGAPGEWTTVLSTEQLIDPEAYLRPVTWSAQSGAFYAPSYGVDGRMEFFDPHLLTSLSPDKPTSSAEAEEEGAGYLLAIDLWFRTGAAKVTTYLSGPELHPPAGMANGTYVVGVPTWSTETQRNESGGKGAENAIRIGFLTYDESYEEGKFYIYEPNTREDEVPTMSIDGTTLQGDGVLIQQRPSSWSEQSPPLNGTVDYVMGDFVSDNTDMFMLVADTPRRVTLFVWLEGQDADCVNSISAGKILANLKFAASIDEHIGDIGRPEGGDGANE